MPLYDVRLTEPAEAEIQATYLRLQRGSLSAADRWLDGIYHAIGTLDEFPSRCAIAPENPRFDREIRQLLFRHGRSTYRVLFTIFEAVDDEPAFVRVIHVRHAAAQYLGEEAPDEAHS
jgi:hypothetical protein